MWESFEHKKYLTHAHTLPQVGVTGGGGSGVKKSGKCQTAHSSNLF